MNRPLRIATLALASIAVSASAGRAQEASPTPSAYFTGQNSVYGAPGFYGTSWGTASYGIPRTFSEYNSPYGAGYGGGYAPPTVMPGPFGEGLWHPSAARSIYPYGASNHYRTFPAESWPNPRGSGPMFGAYAPAYGPAPLPIRFVR